jgi:hypothetical protein
MRKYLKPVINKTWSNNLYNFENLSKLANTQAPKQKVDFSNIQFSWFNMTMGSINDASQLDISSTAKSFRENGNNRRRIPRYIEK